jgi:ABC-type multidrug transport system ATPase subunit
MDTLILLLSTYLVIVLSYLTVGTQEDALFGNLTVYETLLYAARFQLPSSTTRAEMDIIINDLMKEFGLEHVRDTIIGTPLRKGCSGGQVRRVSVASQLIGSKSGILFLDEPTSGLDSLSAYTIIKLIRDKTIRQQSTVLATIHQPSSETFDLFSHLLILGAGSTVFFGTREEAIVHFQKIERPIPSYANPSDVYLQMTNVDFEDDREIGIMKVKGLIEAYKESSFGIECQNHINDINSDSKKDPNGKKGTYENGFWHQTGTLMDRAFLNAVKNPLSYWVRVAMYVCLAILIGTTWWMMGNS